MAGRQVPVPTPVRNMGNMDKVETQPLQSIMDLDVPIETPPKGNSLPLTSEERRAQYQRTSVPSPSEAPGSTKPGTDQKACCRIRGPMAFITYINPTFQHDLNSPGFVFSWFKSNITIPES